MPTKTVETTATPTARQRLLAAAGELFYNEGIHTVGIDRVIEKAGVAKASLYNTFGSKDELIKAYLQERHERIAKRIADGLVAYESPRDKLLGIFEIQGQYYRGVDYRGCAFVNASAEAQPGSTVEAASDDYRAWIRGMFRDLAGEAGAGDPDDVAGKLVLLYDGSGMSARMDRNVDAWSTARVVAELVLDAALS